MATVINTTKDNLRAVLLAEFDAPTAEIVEVINDVVLTAMQHRGDYHGFSAYLDAEITATVGDVAAPVDPWPNAPLV